MQDIRKQNVYDLAQERLRVIFQNFDNIYISFSGGKDSGVLLNLCIDYIRKHNLKRKIGVFHMDYEIQYNMTIDYVERTFKENQDILDIYHVCVPFRVTTCTSMYEDYWRPWDEDKKAVWSKNQYGIAKIRFGGTCLFLGNDWVTSRGIWGERTFLFFIKARCQPKQWRQNWK